MGILGIGRRQPARQSLIQAPDIDHAITGYYKKYRRSTKWWSACLYSGLFGAAVLSAAAGVLPQVMSGTKNLATVLAVGATLINTINGIGRFDQKWQASRMARAETEQLHIGALRHVGSAELARRLEHIILSQSAGVIGSQPRPDQPQPGDHGQPAGQGQQHAAGQAEQPAAEA